MLTLDEERDLVTRAQAGDRRARERLVLEHRPLVERIAKSVTRRALHQSEDEVQVGFIGLLRALDKFDVSHDVRFNTYARHWIRSEILKHKHKSSGLHIAANTITKRIASNLPRAIAKEYQKNPTATEAEIFANACAALGVSVDEARAVVAAQSTVSIDQPIGEDGDAWIDAIAAPEDEEAEELAHKREVLRQALSQINPHHCEVFEAKRSGMTATDIAYCLDVSRSRVRQIEMRAIERLSAIIANPEPNGLPL